MRGLHRTTQFKKDLKREMKGQHRKTIETDLRPVLGALLDDQPLPQRNDDHALTGNWAHHRECHVKPDLLLIYRKLGDADGELWLDRLGSHSELGL